MSKLKDRPRALTWRRGVLLGALLLLLVLGGFKAQRVWGLMRSLQNQLDRLQAAADGDVDLGLGGVSDSLRGAYSDLQALRGEVGFLMPLTRFLGWVPWVGGDLQAAPALLDVALIVTEAGTAAFEGLEPLIELTEGDNGEGSLLPQALQILSDARPSLEAAQARLTAAMERRTEIDDNVLSTRAAALVTRLDRYLPLMQTALDGGRLLPDLAGLTGRRVYLILAQNNDELRATGGFISAVGLLTLDDGGMVEVTFEDSYAVDDFGRAYPDSPPTFLRYMGIDQWVFRDANWSPDFPTSAQKAIQLYQISRDLEVDGVLAVDQQALQAVVTALAPLEVEDWPEAVTGENVISLIRLAWSSADVEFQSGFNHSWWQQRKRFIGDLFGAMQAKIEAAPDQVNWLALAKAFLQILDERHMQIWLADSTSAAVDLLSEQGWDGAVRQATSDYLMVVDTNMGFNKVNAAVQEGLDYRVLVNADGTAQATLTVRHVNPASGGTTCDPRPRYGADYDDLINRCYWDFLRVYAPAGSQLFAVTAHPVAGEMLVTGQKQTGVAEVLPEEQGKAVFGSFFVLPRGEETETRFVYQLPQTALAPEGRGERYRLLVQKQAGTHAIPLQVTLVLPPGASVGSVEPSDKARGGPSTVFFDMTLEEDRFFEVFFQYNEHLQGD